MGMTASTVGPPASSRHRSYRPRAGSVAPEMQESAKTMLVMRATQLLFAAVRARKPTVTETSACRQPVKHIASLVRHTALILRPQGRLPVATLDT